MAVLARTRAPTCGFRFVAVAAGLSAATILGSAQDRDSADRIRQVILDASRALQAGNAPLFLSAFDRRAVPDFERLREQVTALAAQRRIASSVESGTPEGCPDECTVRVNWLLDLTPKVDPGPVERRSETLALGMRRRGNRWQIVRVEPSNFFASAVRRPR